MHDLPDAGWDVPGWMLARVLDNYFAGEEPVPQGATDAEFDETARVQLGIASCGTQTDFSEVPQADDAGDGRRTISGELAIYRSRGWPVGSCASATVHRSCIG